MTARGEEGHTAPVLSVGTDEPRGADLHGGMPLATLERHDGTGSAETTAG
ncbi:hypothetical protein [Actinoallomurus acaciae]|uniref:Uncharacterized protein n=1 Tax=Actinoallomurus acaciae TaxID=502577 RepID=A0ABV5YT90_9ACTN